MIKSHRSLRVVALTYFSLVLLLSGCAATTSRTQSFATSFLPAAPPPDALSTSEPPPVVAGPSAYANEKPNLLEHLMAAQTALSETDVRIHKADDSFEAGKRAYQAGDAAKARREFDRALDILLTGPDGNAAERARLEKKVDQLVDRIYRYDLEGLGAGEVRQEVAYDKPP